IVKPPEQMMKMRLRPNRLATQPTGAVMMAAATMYEVNTQLIWSCDADSVPCMYGSATLAIVVSSACMMVAVMAQIVTMLRRRPGTAIGAEFGMTVQSCSWFAAAGEKPSRPASERRWLVSIVA